MHHLLCRSVTHCSVQARIAVGRPSSHPSPYYGTTAPTYQLSRGICGSVSVAAQGRGTGSARAGISSDRRGGGDSGARRAAALSSGALDEPSAAADIALAGSVAVGGAGGLDAAAADNIADLEGLRKPLAFVNRYAEALDVLVPNLNNHECLRSGLDVKFDTPLASQPPGTGKTALGLNIPAILRRPRGSDAEEAAVAARLRTAWCWSGGPAPAVEAALKDTESRENIVVRTLLAHFEHHHDTLLALKDTQPLLIQMKGLVTSDSEWKFDKALAYAIFCSARGLDGSEPDTRGKFLAQDPTLQSPVGAVKSLIRERGNSPVLLVLDDITDLAHPMFADYFTVKGTPDASGSQTALRRAMGSLSMILQLLNGIPRCFVYCTGRSLWLTSRALVGSSSPLLVQPTLLQPLTAGDVMEALSKTVEPSGRPLLDCLGVPPAMTETFAARVQQLTGGVGRVLQMLLRARQRECIGAAAAPLRSREDVDAALYRLMARLSKVPGVVLRVDWDGPAVAAAAGDVPGSLLRENEQLRLLQQFARRLLLDVRFDPDASITVGGERVRLVDAASVLGLSYGPARADPAAAAPAASSATQIRLVAGEWLCRSLLEEPSIVAQPSMLATAELLAGMRSFGGTMRGRLFEFLCAEALCFRSMVAAGSELSKLLPHLSGCARSGDAVPALRVVALPKVTADAASLTADSKAELLLSRQLWTGAATINPTDLAWLLSEWLPVGCLGVPVSAESGSQDMFLRLIGGVVGFALKAVGESAATNWSDLRDELAKAPSLPPHLPYTLVLWSWHLAPQLQQALGRTGTAVYGAGSWKFARGTLKPRARGQGESFEVAKGQELVISNPHAPAGSGLHELLGSRIMEQLQRMPSSADFTQIVLLADWTAISAPKP